MEVNNVIVECPACNGTGGVDVSRWPTCDEHGNPRKRTYAESRRMCPKCQGEGKLSDPTRREKVY